MKKILFLSLFCLIFITGCVQLEAPKANYVETRIGKVDLQGVELNFLFDVENKNPIPLEVSGYSYKIYVNNRELLSESRPGFSLPVNGKKRLSMPVFVRYDKVLDSVIGVALNIAAGKMYFDYKIDGSLSAGAAGITVSAPLQTSGRVNIPKDALKISM